jgi:hypothetical protein
MQEAMTEEQRMEEGRRMFQIFAARMFEQRVLQAYREKVAAERQISKRRRRQRRLKSGKRKRTSRSSRRQKKKHGRMPNLRPKRPK